MKNFIFPSVTIKVISIGRMRWMRHVARMWDIRKRPKQKIFESEHLQRKATSNTCRKCVDNITINIR